MAGEIRRIWQYIGTHFFRGNVVVGYGQTTPRLSFGGTTSSYPSLAPSGSSLIAWLADGSTYGGLSGSFVRGLPQLISTGNNGGILTITVAEELLTVAAAATSDTVANLLPEKSIILAVSCRVTVAIPSATSFTLGGASAGGPFTNAVGVTTSPPSTDNGMVAVPYLNASAQKVRLTISGSNPANNTGRVRISVFYISSTASTS